MAAYTDRVLVLDANALPTRAIAGDTVTLNANLATAGTGTFDFGSSGAVTASGNPTVNTGTGTVTIQGSVSQTGTGTFGTGTGTFTHNGAISLAANVNATAVAGTGAFDFSAGTGIFKTSTGANTLSGDVTVAANKNVTAASGTTAFDFSAGSGIFKTSTGTNTIGGATVFAQDKGVTVTAGTSAFDFSGGTGVFKTSTGAVTIGPGAVGISGAITASAAGTALAVTNNATVGGTLGVTGAVTLSSDLSVAGDLTVTGTTFTTNAENVLIADNHLYLNAGYNTVVAQSGGLVVNYLPTATTTTVNGAYTAGVASTSNPTIVTTGSATFALADFVQISGSALPDNNGLFEVFSHVTTTLTLRGIGNNACVEDFTQNQVTTGSSDGATIRKVNVSVMRVNSTSGKWQTGKGAVTPVTFADIDASVTLQTAYDNSSSAPATITTNATDGAVLIAGDQKLQITATSGLDLDGPLTADGTTFDVSMSGAVTIDSSGGAISIGADAVAQAINVGTGAAARTITVGNVTGATAVNLNAGTGGMTFTTTGAGDFTVAGSDTVLIDAAGVLELNSSAGAISIGNDAVAQAINVGTGAAARTITVGNGTGATSIVLNAGTGAINIGANDFARTTSIATGAAAQTVVMGSVNTTSSLTLDAGTGDILIGGFGAARTTRLAGGAAAQTVFVGSTNTTSSLTLDSGTGTIAMGSSASARTVNIATGAAVQTVTVGSTNSTSSLTLDSGTGTINIGNGAQARSVNVGTGGAAQVVTVGSTNGASSLSLVAGSGNVGIGGTGATTSISVIDNTASAFRLKEGSTNYISIDTVNGAEKVTLSQFVHISASMGVGVIALETIAAGDVLYITNNAGTVNAGLADANSAGMTIPVGSAMGSASAAANCNVASAHGVYVACTFAAAPAAANIGAVVYLSETAGRATLTPPTASGSTVFRLGVLGAGNGVATLCNVLWMPQFIALNP